jgi:alkylation response protein AidB-like acyl-CoA dehydrogenase
MKSYEELHAIVRDLEPILRKFAPMAEADCNVPKEAIDAIREAGLFRIWIPEKLGGWDVDPVTACRIFEDIARIDSAASWSVQMSNGVTALGRFFGDQAVAEIYAGGSKILADAFAPPGAAVPVEGGYHFTGQFPFGSGCRHADWFMALGLVMDDGQPRMDEGNPVIRIMAFPMADAEVVDNWDTLGMRGTGSDDVKVEDLFVPEHLTAALAPIEGAANAAWSPAMNNMSVWHIIASIATTPLGVAATALEEFVAVAKAKTAAYQTETVDRHTLSHYRLGKARATLNAARAGLYDAMAKAWEDAQAGTFITAERKCDLQLAGSFAARAARDAVELIAASAGANAFRHSSSLTRHLRDLRTTTQHAYISTDRYEDVGAITLGQTQKWGFLFF